MPIKPAGLCAKSIIKRKSLKLKIFIRPGVCAADGIKVSRKLHILGLKSYKNVASVAADVFDHKRNRPAKVTGISVVFHAYFPVAFLYSDIAVLVNTGYSSSFAMRFDDGVIFVTAKIGHFTGCRFAHLHAILIIGI